MTSLPPRIELITDVPERVVAYYAHPDDADVSCGGTLAAWASAGAEVHIVICALGDKGSSDPQTQVSELVEQRQQEAAAAAKVLDVSAVHALGRYDGAFENDLDLRGELVEIVRQVRPEIVIGPDPTAVFFGEHYVNHRDHRIVGYAILDTIFPAASSPLYFPERGRAHVVQSLFLSGSLEPTVAVDISSTVDQKAEAILCHKSQLGETAEWFRVVVRERAEQAGRLAGVPFAEPFRRIGHSS